MKGSSWACLGGLGLRVEECRLEPHEQATTGGWTRLSTEVVLSGGGCEGRGEDVTYSARDQELFRAAAPDAGLSGSFTLDSFASRLDGVELFPRAPEDPVYRLYRRWAFESAALDLALNQAGLRLDQLLDRSVQDLDFVVSLGLGEPPDPEALVRLRRRYPDVRFKVDLGLGWTRELVARMAALGGIGTVDFKGRYHGAYAGTPPDPQAYALVAELLPEAWIEDPSTDAASMQVLSGVLERVAWDAPIHSLADVLTSPFPPRCLNIKPSRFGMASELFRVYDYCAAKGIAMYGGGQFELASGRAQIQYLASLFHPAAPNDVAPAGFNASVLVEGLPSSPIPASQVPVGFGPDRRR